MKCATSLVGEEPSQLYATFLSNLLGFSRTQGHFHIATIALILAVCSDFAPPPPPKSGLFSATWTDTFNALTATTAATGGDFVVLFLVANSEILLNYGHLKNARKPKIQKI